MALALACWFASALTASAPAGFAALYAAMALGTPAEAPMPPKLPYICIFWACLACSRPMRCWFSCASSFATADMPSCARRRKPNPVPIMLIYLPTCCALDVIPPMPLKSASLRSESRSLVALRPPTKAEVIALLSSCCASTP